MYSEVIQFVQQKSDFLYLHFQNEFTCLKKFINVYIIFLTLHRNFYYHLYTASIISIFVIFIFDGFVYTLYYRTCVMQSLPILIHNFDLDNLLLLGLFFYALWFFFIVARNNYNSKYIVMFLDELYNCS